MRVKTFGFGLAFLSSVSVYSTNNPTPAQNPTAADFSCAQGLERLNFKKIVSSFEFPPSLQEAEPSPFAKLDPTKFPSVFRMQRFATENVENNIEVYYLTGAQLFQQGAPKNGYLVVTPEGVSFFEQADTFSREQLEPLRDLRSPYLTKGLEFAIRKDLKLALPNGKAIYLQHQQILTRHPLTYGLMPGSWRVAEERVKIDGRGSFASAQPPLMTNTKWVDVAPMANVSFASVRPFLVDNLSRELYGIAMQLREHGDKIPLELKHAYRALFDTHCKNFIANNFPYLKDTKKGSVAYAYARALEVTRQFPARPPIQEKPLMPARPLSPEVKPEAAVLASTHKKENEKPIAPKEASHPATVPQVAAMSAPFMTRPKADGFSGLVEGFKNYIAPPIQFSAADFPKALECLRGIEDFHDSLPEELRKERQPTGVYTVNGSPSLHYHVKNLPRGLFVMPTVKPVAGYYVYRSTPQGEGKAHFFAERSPEADDISRELKVYTSAQSGDFEVKRERGYVFDNGKRAFPFSAQFADQRDFGEISLAGVEDLPAAPISSSENSWKPFSDLVHGKLHALASQADHLIEGNSDAKSSKKRTQRLLALAEVCKLVPAFQYTAMALEQSPTVQRYREFDSEEPLPMPAHVVPQVAATPQPSGPAITKKTYVDGAGNKRERITIPVR